jgi:hypothetical protein
LPTRFSLAMLPVVIAGAGCARRDAPAAALAPVEALDSGLRPAALAAALRRLPGAHFQGSATFRVGAARRADPGETPLAPDAVTTQTELWLDGKGNYRLVETNDRDGGREVILVGRDLSVALRNGKAIRRPAQEPEPTRLLEEAVGAPFAAWETVRRFAAVERTAAGSYRIGKSATPRPAPASPVAPTPLRRWRDTVAVESLEGEARLDERTGALVAFALRARFTADRDGTALAGETAVTARTDGIGTTPAIAAPIAEDLQLRQRTILEERALLPGSTQEAR